MPVGRDSIPGLALLSFWFLIAAAPPVTGSGAAPPQSGPSGSRVANGTWGSRQAGMQVSDSGAVLEFNCARGTIDEPLRLDAGRFKLRGTYTREPADPPAVGDRPESHPAIYAGHLKGTELTFELRLEDTKEVVGTFIVVEGKAPWVPHCH